ncbi:MAG: hypothetical protein MI810_21170 [Flavobacteriales bacterium]|nr:hypothetical protein [Flavobacteriales bacterium]
MKTLEEAIQYYSSKKNSGEMSMSQVREELKLNGFFSNSEIDTICREISDRELDDIIDPENPLKKFFGSIYFAYFFTVFWGAALVAVFVFGAQIESRISNIPSWVYLLGMGLLLVKNLYKIYQFHSRKR